MEINNDKDQSEISQDDGFKIGYKLTKPRIPLPIATRSLFEFTNFEVFSKMSDEELSEHIALNRSEAEKSGRWPCLDVFSHLPPNIRIFSPKGQYERILNHLKENPNEKILDMGCMFGVESRSLIQDGLKPDQIVNADLIPQMENFGYHLFKDFKDSIHNKGVNWSICDIFNDKDVENLKNFAPNGFYAIWTSRFIHLFNLERQQLAVKQLIKLLSKKSGSTIFGTEQGRLIGKDGSNDKIVGLSYLVYGKSSNSNSNSNSESQSSTKEQPVSSRTMYYHSVESYQKLYEEISPNSFYYDIQLSFNPKRRLGDGEFCGISEEILLEYYSHYLHYAIIRK